MSKKKLATWIIVAFMVLACGSFTLPAQAEGDVQEASEQTGAKEGEHSVKYIHLNSHDGDDKNDGLTEESSVKTFAKAKSLIQDGDIILLDSYVEVTKDETWDLKEFPNSRLQRNAGGDMIVVNPKATLTLQNIVIDGTHYSDQDVDCHSIIKLGKLAGTKDNGSNIILKSGTRLQNNTNDQGTGGAIGGFSYDTITMEEGAVIQNDTAQFGGGIHLENHGKFIMRGGVIEDNRAVRGGGVCLIASSMEMDKGEIKNNSANSKDSYQGHYGGGVYVSNFQDWAAVGGDYSREIAGEASFTMNGGTISGNEATYQASNGDNGLGGAIATYPAFYAGYEKAPSIIITINKGDITDNKAINGGAISAYFEATDANISNANITNNEAKSQGGAIYNVFNASVNLTDTVISENRAAIGAGAYLHSSEMTMTSGEFSNNIASRYGGGILIDSPAWNKKTAICTILGGTVSGNKADAGKGSDGIYQNSKLNIGEKALINKDNDVYLPSGRVIDVIKPLENITQEDYVSITSEDCVVEDEQNAGTPLVRYHEEAGGISAAQKAEYHQLYIPSSYMQEGLTIGKSQADKQLDYMTYVQKEKYPVDYEFISGTDGMELPDEVKKLLPIDKESYWEGTVVKSIQPQNTVVDVTDGTWNFKGYDAEEKSAAKDLKFIGTWVFTPDETISGDGGGDKPKPDKPEQNKPGQNQQENTEKGTVKTADEANTMEYVLLMLVSALFIGILMQRRRVRR